MNNEQFDGGLQTLANYHNIQNPIKVIIMCLSFEALTQSAKFNGKIDFERRAIEGACFFLFFKIFLVMPIGTDLLVYIADHNLFWVEALEFRQYANYEAITVKN